MDGNGNITDEEVVEKLKKVFNGLLNAIKKI
jgi:hypothetical protein